MRIETNLLDCLFVNAGNSWGSGVWSKLGSDRSCENDDKLLNYSVELYY